MTNALRLASRSLLALAVFSLLSLPAGAATFKPREPTITGSYLAGTQALFDLRTDDAERYFHDALSVDGDNPLVAERAFVAFAANGNVEAAATTAARLLEATPTNDLARLVVGTHALKQGRYDAVIDELATVKSESFAGITGGILRAWAFVGAGRRAEADQALDQIAAGGLEDFLVFHRALMAEVTGDTETALAYAQQAYDVDPLVARIVEAYARLLGNAGRFDEASEVIAKFEAQGLSHPLVSDVKAAIEMKRRPGPFATSVQAGASEMFHGFGVALARDGSADVAVLFLRLGLYLEPQADVVSLVLGQLLDRAGQHVSANAIYDGIPSASPMKPTAVVRMAENLSAMGDQPEALRRLSRIVAANPKDLDAISVLGDMQRNAQLYGDAASTYSKALALTGGNRPGDWRFYYVRGISYERNKQWPLAEGDFKRALELRPDQPQVLNYLGYSWVDQGVNLAPALDMIEKAVQQAPNDGYIVDSLGWAFFRLHRFEEAVETLERAVQLRPNDPEINDHLGDAYWRAGRTLEARFQWTIAGAVDKEGEVKERVQPKLASGLEPLPPAPGGGTVAANGASAGDAPAGAAPAPGRTTTQ